MREHPEDTYRRWWCGKRCRPAYSKEPFRRVVDVKFSGPPSGFYGDAALCYEDGTEDYIFHGDAFRPRKFDVEVEGETKRENGDA